MKSHRKLGKQHLITILPKTITICILLEIAQNKEGKVFYIVKNSSPLNGNGGYVYMSKEYLQLKTISVMTHKNGIPKDIVNKLTVKL
jgi:hypothetical protein